MNKLALVKKNRSLMNLTIMISLGWLFLTTLSIFFFFNSINEAREFELSRIEVHYETIFENYNNKLDLISTYITEHSSDINQAEFELLASELFHSTDYIDHVTVAPEGVIELVYPATSTDQLNYDILSHATIAENALLFEAIENNTLTYQYDVSNDKVNSILMRKPIFAGEEFYGFVTITISSNVFSEMGHEPETSFIEIALYNDLDEIIYGVDNSKDYDFHELSISGINFKLGENMKNSFILNKAVYLFAFIAFLFVLVVVVHTILYRVFYKYNKARDELIYRKNYDPETDLLNIERLYADVDSLVEDKEEFYLSFLNINNVKYINDKFGHKQTSALLLKTSGMISRVIRNNSTLYRYGGDEYVLVTKTDSGSEIKNLLRRIVKIFESDIVSGTIKTRLTLTIGVTNYPKNGYSTEELIKNAHLTSMQVTNYDKEGFQFFRQDKIRESVLTKDFDKVVAGLNLELFEVYLMPIVDVQSNQISGFECLTRAFDDIGKQLPTEDVVLSLERNGKIQILDEIVFKKMLSIMKRLNKEFPKEEFFLSLNASALSLNEEYVKNVIRMYQQAKLKKGQIVLELTESYQVDDYDYLIELFKTLNENGIMIGIDDFGSGYSSISYISKFPIYAIKVDKEYVRDYNENEFNRTLMKTLLSIAGVLNCKLVAEGVDNRDTLEYLKEMQCPFYQGYLFSKGVPFEDAVALIKNSLSKNKRVE